MKILLEKLNIQTVNSGACTGTDFAAAGILCGFSCKADITVHPPHARPDSMAIQAVARTPAMTSRQRPPLDIARGFTGWGISLQLRAEGTWVDAWLTDERQSQPPENAPARAIPVREPVR